MSRHDANVQATEFFALKVGIDDTDIYHLVEIRVEPRGLHINVGKRPLFRFFIWRGRLGRANLDDTRKGRDHRKHHFHGNSPSEPPCFHTMQLAGCHACRRCPDHNSRLQFLRLRCS